MIDYGIHKLWSVRDYAVKLSELQNLPGHVCTVGSKRVCPEIEENDGKMSIADFAITSNIHAQNYSTANCESQLFLINDINGATENYETIMARIPEIQDVTIWQTSEAPSESASGFVWQGFDHEDRAV